jgi:hypothetical protein
MPGFGGHEWPRIGLRSPCEFAMRIAVLSDLHVLGLRETERSRRIARDLGADRAFAHRTLRRGLHRVRSRFWNRRADDREACFLRALDDLALLHPDWIIANGDYSGDTGGIGLSDPRVFESVARVVDLLRRSFPERCLFTFGDHELGKFSTELKRGGIRMASLRRGEDDLGIESFWHRTKDRLHLVGVNSTLLTLSLYLPEALEEEIPLWQEQRARHLENIRRAFSSIPPGDRILLFCHDPSALGDLAGIPEVQTRIGQIAQTVLGHLHYPGLLKITRWIGRLPILPRYPVARIIAHGAKSAAAWSQFRPVVCPATFGLGPLLPGGFLHLDITPDHLKVTRHRLDSSATHPL